MNQFSRLKQTTRNYLSLILLFAPALLFVAFLFYAIDQQIIVTKSSLLFFPWQIFTIAFFGIIATIGGVLDWRFHRNPLNLKIPKKERDAEAFALGLGGLPMFFLMIGASLSAKPHYWLIPIVIVLIYTVVAICYDEFVFHIKRCSKKENFYHRMLVFGNGIAWLAWFHLIYVA